MIAVDTNILVHAHRADSVFHQAAFRCVESLATGNDTWAIPWPCLHEFLAIVTNPKAFRPPTTLDGALDQADAWLASPSLLLLQETSDHWSRLAQTLRRARVTGGLVHDARIAALCIEHRVREMWTADRDFSRFTELATFNPLLAGQVHETPTAYAAIRRARAAGRRRAVQARVRPAEG